MINRSTVIAFIILAMALPALAVNGVALDPSRNIFNARQLGMGGVSIGFANDANSIFTNPSGLTKAEFPQLTASSRKIMLDETSYSLLGWAVPTDYGTFGIGYIAMGSGGSFPTTLDPNTGRIILNTSLEAGSNSNSVLAFSYCREMEVPRLENKLSVGGNLKLFNQALSGGGYSDQGSAMSIDLGANYLALPWLKVGAVLQNLLGGTIKWNGSEDKLGSTYRLGAAVNVLGSSEEALREYPQPLKAEIDIELPSGVLSSSNSMLLHLGTEYFIQKNISLRAGINQEATGSGLTLGVGFINGGFRFDYAYAQRAGLPGDAPHYFSLSYIGERVLTISKKLKGKTAHLKFLSPRDRMLTDQSTLELKAEAWGEKVIDRKKTWTVTAISATQEITQITEPEPLDQLYLGGKKLEKQGTIESQEDLVSGRNVFRLVGYTSPEIVSADNVIPAAMHTAEARVLKVSPFTDTPITNWAAEPIYLNVVLGLITGYPNNTFKPDKGITRAELVTLLVRSLGLPSSTIDPYGSFEVFSDVKTKHWAAKFITYGNAIKYVTGYPDNTFKPNKVLTRAEGVTILARYAGLTEEAAGTAPYPDLAPEFWANKYIAPAKAAGLLKYLEGRTFVATGEFTRAEASEVLYRVPAIQKKANEFWETGIVSAAQR
jgi:hypothetical protein